MTRKIERVTFDTSPPKPIRVAAYARVSSGKDAMLHSLSAQVSYYSQLIQSHGGWEYVGVYADEAKTGTKDTRENFCRLLADCRAGKINVVLTKSISRFARNTITLLETVRELKSLGIDVFFEEQNIHTLSGDGELMLSILASYAQEESLSASENQKWRIRKNFQEGLPAFTHIFGYRYENHTFAVVPNEAEVVRRIYDDYLSGKGYSLIAKELTADGISPKKGLQWNRDSVANILHNYTYTGNLLLQKTYKENHITKKKLLNRGILPKYHVENSHEAIISLATFQAVQAETAHRAERFKRKVKQIVDSPLSDKIRCAYCGKNYNRKTVRGKAVWICSTFNKRGKAYCNTKQIPETALLSVILSITNDVRKVKEILADKENLLIVRLTDNSEVIIFWKDHSRKDSWTPEMKEQARQNSLKRLKVEDGGR